ncbi:MAG: DUF1273 domain-containing protein [Firmicutes bacterium]|nr:DUF1273 domain-containing protein [Bacillota bacterium]
MRTKPPACCFTGHRNIPVEQYEAVQKRLEVEIVGLIHQGISCFYTGGALGFDTMAALAILKLKPEFPQILFILALPCEEQTMGWTPEDVKIYNQIREKADKVVYTSKCYYTGCLHKRSRYLVNQSVVCVCYLTENKGGTVYAVYYAKRRGLRVINLAL